MRTIKTYFKGAPFYNAFLRTWPSRLILVSLSGHDGWRFHLRSSRNLDCYPRGNRSGANSLHCSRRQTVWISDCVAYYIHRCSFLSCILRFEGLEGLQSAQEDRSAKAASPFVHPRGLSSRHLWCAGRRLHDTPSLITFLGCGKGKGTPFLLFRGYLNPDLRRRFIHSGLYLPRNPQARSEG
jgi:hypothetical protein